MASAGAVGYYYGLGDAVLRRLDSSGQAVSPDPSASRLSPFYPETQVSVLLLGTDDKIERGRTDTMILLLLDFQTKKLGALSLPRDTRVYLPGCDYQKINAAYPLGGPQMTLDVVNHLLGTEVWYYIKTDLAGFQKIVDLLGGVDLTVEKRMWYRDHAQGLTINLYPGPQHLDGRHAMQYVRFRRDAAGDLGRMKRQQKLMKALAKKVLETRNLTKLPQVVQQVREQVQTNLNLAQQVALANFLREVDLEKVVAEQLPTTPERIDGRSYLLPTEPGQAVVARLIDRMIRATTVLVCSDETLFPAAEDAAARLREEGFETKPPVAEAELNAERTTVFDVTHRAEEAARIATLLDGQVEDVKSLNLPENPDVDVIVVLGENYKTDGKRET
jgi:LCP family protein required for cell wall assembly